MYGKNKYDTFSFTENCMKGLTQQSPHTDIVCRDTLFIIETDALYYFNVVPPSATHAQHYNNTGLTARVAVKARPA